LNPSATKKGKREKKYELIYWLVSNTL
jgi:hypothetical protein